MNRTAVATLLIAALALSGCATKKFVRTETGTVEERMNKQVGEGKGEVDATQNRLNEQSTKHDRDVATLSKTAQEALDRAIAAGKLAEGKFLYETVLTDDMVKFGFDRANLSPEARSALDAFAAGIKSKNEDVYIEIQGHTDSTGPEEYNYDLGLKRAMAVLRYLNMEQGFALHRMSVISYGETKPVDGNGSPENRARNRRVVLVVLK
jgi:peptidoglycan-associated lipoprotein